MSDERRRASEARIAFAGTPAFAVPALQAILAAGAEVPIVLTQPDRRAGRGRRVKAPPVKETALEVGINVEQPDTLSDPELKARLARIEPDLLVVVAYGLIVPAWLLEWPRHGVINVHASLLPRWRGAAPIQRAILAGDEWTGVSIMKMDAGLDTGPVYATEALRITDEMTGGMLHDRLSRIGARLLISVIERILEGTISPEPQPRDGVTYAEKLHKHEARIDWREPAVVIDRKVRALNPWPVAETELSDGRRLRIWEAEVVEIEHGARPGTVVRVDADRIIVAAGAGAIALRTIQAPAGKVIGAGAYLAARPLNGADFAA